MTAMLAAVLATAGRPPPPAGWVVVPLATLDQQEHRWCLNRSPREWVASEAGGQVVLAPQPRRRDGPALEPDLWASLRRAGFSDREVRGLAHRVSVDDGWIAGFNRGEFGGGLWWVGRGGERRELAVHHGPGFHPENVQALVTVGPRVLALEGLDHTAVNEGSAVWVERHDDGWRARLLVDLGAAPFGIVPDGPGTWIVGTVARLVRLTAAGEVTALADLPRGLAWLYPRSLAREGRGPLYIAARHHVLRALVQGDGAALELLGPADCPTRTGDPDHCRCTAVP